MTEARKKEIEAEIHEDLAAADAGISELPIGARNGVRLASLYYKALLRKIERTPAVRIREERIRISNGRKFGMLISTYVQRRLTLVLP